MLYEKNLGTISRDTLMWEISRGHFENRKNLSPTIVPSNSYISVEVYVNVNDISNKAHQL